MSSFIWWLVDKVHQLSFVMYPILLGVVALIWFIKARSKLSILALSGAFLTISAHISHRFVQSVYSYRGSMIPTEDQNIIVWFLYLKGLNIGQFLFGVALLLYFIKNKQK